MTLEFAQASHDLLESVLIEKLAAINAASFQPSELQTRMLKSFGKGSHRLSYFIGYNKGNMRLDKDVAVLALEELIAHKFLTVLSGPIYYLTFKATAFLSDGKNPLATPPRTLTNSTPTKELYSLPKLNLRDGWDDHFRHKSMNPCAPQVERVGA